MNRLIVLAFFALMLPCTSFAAKVPPPATVGESCASDGRAGKLGGVAQYPDLLKGYLARSPCLVAGVDYAVGLPKSRILKDPTVPANLPRGLTYNPAQKLVRCDSASKVIVQDLDFSLHGGVGLYMPSCSDVLIRYNRFQIGKNCLTSIMQGKDSIGIVIEYNEFDGGGGSTSDGCDASKIGETVSMNGVGGIKKVSYNYFRNAPQHYVSFNGNGKTPSGTIVLQYNFIEKCGFYKGSHCNGFQIVGGAFDGAIIAHNTFYSPQPGASGYPSGLVIPISFMAQLGGVLTNGRIFGNTIVTTRPAKTVSYAIYCGAESSAGGPNTGTLIFANYIDARGAYGPFYPNAPCAGAWKDPRANIDMVTGRPLKRP